MNVWRGAQKGTVKNTQLVSDTEVQLNIIKFKFNCKLKFSSSAIHRVLFQQIIGNLFSLRGIT